MTLLEQELKMIRVGKYMQAQEQSRRFGRKTSTWLIYSLRGDALGLVDWYGPWRQYVYTPKENTIYSVGCMKDLNAFIGGLRSGV